jgi:hypothetical protein
MSRHSSAWEAFTVKDLDCRSGADQELTKRCFDVIETVVVVLRLCGVTESQVQAVLDDVLRETSKLPTTGRNELSNTAEFHLLACDIVFSWRRESRYVDHRGLPNRLPISGLPPSFEGLVRAVTGSADLNAFIDYLEALGAVRRVQEDQLELLTESVLACSGKKGASIAAQTVLAHVHDFLQTVRFNLADKDSNQTGRFERACFGRIPPAFGPILERFVEERGQNFVDSIDDWLARHSVRDGGTDAQLVCVAGAGAYVFLRQP